MQRNEKILYLQEKARELRKNVLTMIYSAQSGHPGGSLSAADMMAALYFSELHVDPQNPHLPTRDRFVLSKGHVSPVLYSCLIMRGFMPEDTLYTLRKHGSALQGHPDMKRTPGVDISTGSLGQGISCAVGMAIAIKRDGSNSRVFCMLGDGECDEGQVWEAVESAVKYELDNMVILVDNNGLQNDGTCDDIMPTQNLSEKFHAFGCDVWDIDGHDMGEIVDVLDAIRTKKSSRPSVIVAKTVKGRGVSFMENVVAWHGVAPNQEQYAKAIAEIDGGLQ